MIAHLPLHAEIIALPQSSPCHRDRARESGVNAASILPVAVLKFCTTCRHKGTGRWAWDCLHPATARRPEVKPAVGLVRPCYEARINRYLCGPEGRYWEAAS